MWEMVYSLVFTVLYLPLKMVNAKVQSALRGRTVLFEPAAFGPYELQK